MTTRTELQRALGVEQQSAEQATGCIGSGDYAIWASQQGYSHCEVYDWTSSAGDWSFIVSKDGLNWHMMFQSDNWPRAGFTRTIDTGRVWVGTSEEVLKEIWEENE